MQWFNAYAVFPRQVEPAGDAFDSIQDALIRCSPSVGMSPDGCPQARISLQAGDLESAEREATRVIKAAFAEAGVGGDPTVSVQTEEEFLRAEGFTR